MRIASIASVAPVSIECDGYVPIIVEFAGGFEWPPKYWRTGDFETSLIEIGVDPRDKTICSITVTSLSSLPEKSKSEALPLEDFQPGLPRADPAIWSQEQWYVDDKCEVKAVLIEDQLIVAFGDLDQPMTNSVICGQVVFLIDKMNVLRGFTIHGLTEREIENLRSTTAQT